MVDWIKIFANSIVTGAITAVAMLASSGFNSSAALIAAVLAGVTSFLVEFQKESNATTAGKLPQKGSKLTIF
jgi:hypothetical protein